MSFDVSNAFKLTGAPVEHINQANLNSFPTRPVLIRSNGTLVTAGLFNAQFLHRFKCKSNPLALYSTYLPQI